MSALLSPPRRLRARFTVPGEGSYELSADVPPPTPRPPPPPPAKPAAPPPPGPLGLPTVTKLAFATDAPLRPPDHPDHEPLFSFRKLTGFTSLTAKFATDDDHPQSQPPNTVPSTPSASALLAYNAADTVYLIDVATPTQELFNLPVRTTPTALAVTAVDGLRLLVGTASGEVVYYPDLSDRRRAATSIPQSCVYNKDGVLNSSRVVAVKWLPHSSHKFLSLHFDGALIVYDDRMKPSTLRPDDNTRPPAPDERPDRDRLRPGTHDLHVTNVKGKRSNPATVLHIGRTSLTDCAFAPSINPDSPSALATTARDGYLRIIDFNNQHITIAFRSYFGALLCVAWSPDGKYVATGGEDDLVSIFSPSEERLVARLEGHTSWVSAVAWDHACDRPGTYRLGSAGQDAKLLLWDFDLETLHHPQRNSMTRRRSYRETNGVSNGEKRQSKISRLRGHTPEPEPHYPLIVPAPGRAEVPLVEPLVAHVAHGEPLTDVWFLDTGVFTADAVGGVKMWSRPPQHAVPELSLGKGAARAATDLD